MTCADDVYSTVVRQAAHDAVRALLAAPPDSAAGTLALRKVTGWLATEHGDDAVRDLAEELAADLAEALAALAPAALPLTTWCAACRPRSTSMACS
jgi:hypothetical protein